MAEQVLWTWQDAIDRVIDRIDSNDSERNVRMARRATLEAYTDLSECNRWSYYEKRFAFNSVASQTTGTIAYTQSTRTVTLSNATWPSNVTDYKFVYSNVAYDIVTRTSSTAIVLSQNHNPGSDISAGASYTIYKDTYALPTDFRYLGSLYDLTSQYELRAVSSDQSADMKYLVHDSPGTPYHYTIRGGNEYLQSLSIILTPPPSTARTFGMVYQRAPRKLSVAEYKTGTVTTSSTTVTGSGTSFPENCVGSVIRFSADGTTTAPTGPVGDIDNTDNLYYAQRIITARASATSITIDSALDSDIASDTGYTISDPIDLEPFSMLNAFWALSEANYANNHRHDDAMQLMEIAERQRRMAIERDNRRTKYAAHKGMAYNPFRNATITGGELS